MLTPSGQACNTVTETNAEGADTQSSTWSPGLRRATGETAPHSEGMTDVFQANGAHDGGRDPVADRSRRGSRRLTAERRPPPDEGMFGHRGAAGEFCTFTSSNIKAIEPGDRIVYAQAATLTSLDADVVIVAGPGTAQPATAPSSLRAFPDDARSGAGLASSPISMRPRPSRSMRLDCGTGKGPIPSVRTTDSAHERSADRDHPGRQLQPQGPERRRIPKGMRRAVPVRSEDDARI